jgi:Protein of unknown function (DUF3037)
MTATSADDQELWFVYEWATIRIVPHVHAEEFINAGVILHARQAPFLDARMGDLWEKKVERLAPYLDRGRLRRHLESYARIARGEPGAGAIALLPPSERFHWLVHPRSGVIQGSPAHPGRCHDPAAALARLVEEQCR